LHDTIEDCNVSLEDIKNIPMIDNHTPEIVYAVTNEEGKNRHERGLKTYPKIRETTKAITVKLSDRIANIEQCVSFCHVGRRPQRLFSMYEKDWPDFQGGLRQRCRGESFVEAAMWSHLDGLFASGIQARERYNDESETGKISI